MPKKDLYSDLLSQDDSSPSDSRTVPNLFPKITNTPYKLAIIGEAPGADEIDQGLPFVGYSGRLLDTFLSRFNILRDACFIGNICQYRPPGNKIASFNWDGPEISGGIAKLTTDLNTFRPNVVLLLGGSALHAFKDPLIVPKKKKTKDDLSFIFPNSISNWRGSFFSSHINSPLSLVKCIPSFHPAACLRQYDYTPYLLLDIKRALDDSKLPDLSIPQRTLLVNLSYQETIQELDRILSLQTPVGTDIEGFWEN